MMKAPSVSKDFDELQEACRSVLDPAFKSDEQAASAKDRLAHQSNFSTKYFVEPYKQDDWGPQFEPLDFVRIPTVIRDRMNHVEYNMSLGLIPELNKSWIVIDNSLFLWNYRTGDVTPFDGLTDPIGAVGLAVPIPGVFTDSVKYLLVVATTLEIVILALAKSERGDYRLVPTNFVVPCDDLQVAGIEGTQDGRIFVAGIDGTVFQLEYDSGNDWDLYLPSALYQRPKCRKIRHSPWSLYIFSPIVSFISAGTTSQQTFVDMKCDNYRKLLHVATAEGKLTTFSLSSTNKLLYCFSSDLVTLTRIYVDEGHARLEANDPTIFTREKFTVVNIVVLPPTESQIAHLMAVLSDGHRIFLSLLDNSGACISADGAPPYNALVCRLRPPPSRDVINKAANPLLLTESRLQVEQCYHCHGVSVLAHSQERQKMVVGLADDFITHLDRLAQISQSRSHQEGVCMLQHPELTRAKVYDIREVSHMLDAECIRELSAMSYSSKCSSGQQKAGACTWLPPPPLVLACAPRGPQMYMSTRLPTDIIPLGELSTQHLTPMRTLLVLTNSGLLVFGKQRPIDYLLKILRRSPTPDTLRDLCSKYKDTANDNNTQVAAMCCALACGVPRDAYASSNLDEYSLGQLTNRILSSMLEISTSPRFKQGAQPYPKQAAHQSVGAVVTPFEFGSAHDGLVLFLSRLIRPIWNRPVFKVDPNQPLNARHTLSQEQIAELVGPLQSLRNILREFFEDSIRRETPPSYARANPNPNPNPNPSTSVQNDVAALDRQQKSINRIYRLVGRISQCLSLVDLLLTAAKSYSIPEKLATINKFTFKELVTSPHAHEKLRVMLNDLVRPSQNISVQIAADFAKDLSSRCFFYFSEGDQLSHHAQTLLALVKAQKLPYGDAERDRLVNEAVRLLCTAAAYWRTSEVVNSSPSSLLSRICADLLSVRAFTGLVDVALKCSENFSSSRDSALSSQTTGHGSYPVYPWEMGLYHRALVEDDNDLCLEHCYDVIINAIANIRRADHDPPIGDSVVREVINHTKKCKDEVFHWKLYRYLLEQDEELLLSLNGELVERFLIENGDSMQLYAYYTENGKHAEAYGLMERLAESEDDISLYERIDYLRNAKDSASRSADSLLSDKVANMDFRIKLASLQNVTLEGLKSLREIVPQLRGALDQSIQDLSRGLKNQEELYNQYAFRYTLWDVCLRIAHICDFDDSSHIHELWKNFIYGLVPSTTTDRTIKHWLAQKNFKRDLRGGNEGVFEEPTWPTTLQRKIEALANHVSKGNSAVFPLSYLVDELEEVAYRHRSRHMDTLSSMWLWPAEVLNDIARSSLQLSEAYFDVIVQIEGLGEDSDRLLRLVLSMVWVLEQWVSRANLEGQSGYGYQDAEPDQFAHEPSLDECVGVGQWDRWLLHLKGAVNALHGGEVHHRVIAEVKRRIDGLRQESNRRRKF